MDSSAALVQAVKTLLDRPGELKEGEAEDLRLVTELIQARFGLQLGESRKHPLVPPLQFPGSRQPSNAGPPPHDVAAAAAAASGPPKTGTEEAEWVSEVRGLQQVVQRMNDRLEAIEARAVSGSEAAGGHGENVNLGAGGAEARIDGSGTSSGNAAAEHSEALMSSTRPKDCDADGRRIPSIEDMGQGNGAQDFLFGEVTHIISRLDKYREREEFHRKQQQNTDKAQDELLTMELDKIRREVHARVSREDLAALEEACEASIKSAQTSMKSFLRGQTQTQDTYLQETLDKVLKQVGVVQGAQESTAHALDVRQEKIKTILVKQSEQTKQMQNDVFRTTNELANVLSKLLDNDREHEAMSKSLETHTDKIEALEAFTKKLEDQIQDLGKKLKAAREEADEGHRAVEHKIGARLDRLAETTQNLVRTERRSVEAVVEQQVAKVKAECDAALTASAARGEEVAQDIASLTGAVAEVQKRFEEQIPQSPRSPRVKGGFSAVPPATLEAQKKLEGDMRRVLRLLFGEVEPETPGEEGEDQFVPPWTQEISAARTVLEAKATAADETASQLGEHVKDLEAWQQTCQEDQQAHGTRIDSVEGSTTELHKTTDSLGGRIDALGVALRTEVKTALVQLVRGSSAAEVESVNSSFGNLVIALRQSEQERQDEIRRLQMSAVSHASLLRHVEGQARALLTKEKEWLKTESQIAAHASVFANHCIVVEQRAAQSRQVDLDAEEQMFISSNVQLVAERIADYADYSVILGMVNADSVDDVDWDEAVEAQRKSLLEAFLNTITTTTTKAHPSFDPVIEQTRQAFVTKVSMSLQVALSKFRRVNIGSTIFGKQKLIPACIACNRPLDASSALGETPVPKRRALPATLSPVRSKKAAAPTPPPLLPHQPSASSPHFHSSVSATSFEELVPFGRSGNKAGSAPATLAPVKSSPVNIPTVLNGTGAGSKSFHRSGARLQSRISEGVPESLEPDADAAAYAVNREESALHIRLGDVMGERSEPQPQLQAPFMKRAALPVSISLGESVVIPSGGTQLKNKSADARSKRSENSATTAVRKAAGQIKWGPASS